MINGTHYVTVATDASSTKTRAGMAYYLRDDLGTVKHAWYLNGYYRTHLAEWMALEAVVELIVSRNYDREHTKLIFYCDNLTMIHLLQNVVKKGSRGKWKVKQEWLHEQLKGFGIEPRHVYSHTNKTDLKRYYLNRWCDFNARSMVRHGRLHEQHR